jgi:hypothetical protein
MVSLYTGLVDFSKGICVIYCVVSKGLLTLLRNLFLSTNEAMLLKLVHIPHLYPKGGLYSSAISGCQDYVSKVWEGWGILVVE